MLLLVSLCTLQQLPVWIEANTEQILRNHKNTFEMTAMNLLRLVFSWSSSDFSFSFFFLLLCTIQTYLVTCAHNNFFYSFFYSFFVYVEKSGWHQLHCVIQTDECLRSSFTHTQSLIGNKNQTKCIRNYNENKMMRRKMNNQRKENKLNVFSFICTSNVCFVFFFFSFVLFTIV